MQKKPESAACACNHLEADISYSACLFHLRIKGMSHFNIAQICTPISVGLKASSLSFSLSGCTDLSSNPTDTLTLPVTGTTVLMQWSTVTWSLTLFCVYLSSAIIDISEITALLHSSRNRSFGTYFWHMPSSSKKQSDSAGISNINRHEHGRHNEDIHTKPNTNWCSIPCAFGTPSLAVHKAVIADKRWMQQTKLKGRLNVYESDPSDPGRP